MPPHPKKIDIEAPPIPKYFFPPKVMAVGDGSYLLMPGKPVAKLTVPEVARATGIHRKTLHKLIQAGIIEAEQPSPNVWLVLLESVERLLESSRIPGFWDKIKRQAYIDGRPPEPRPLPPTAPFDPRKKMRR